MPPWTHHTLERFIQAVTRDIDDSERSPLPKVEEKTLNHLQTCTDIFITNADKGGAVVILDTTRYINNVDRQLNNN